MVILLTEQTSYTSGCFYQSLSGTNHALLKTNLLDSTFLLARITCERQLSSLTNQLAPMLNVLIVDNKSSSLASALQHYPLNIQPASYTDKFVQLVKELQPDALIFWIPNLTEQLLLDLQLISQECPLPVVIFNEDDCLDSMQQAINLEVSVYTMANFNHERVYGLLQLARTRFTHLQQLKQALEDAKTQLEDRKQIDRAKAILIKAKNFSEHEAYHTLRKLAMDRNITLGEMARNVIAMAELLK